MTSIIKFTALSGIDEKKPLCYLLQIDEAHILLDCGWNEEMKEEDVEELGRYASLIDAVLISHPDLLHMGALPYLISRGLNCNIYGTIPVRYMGQMFLYDLWMTFTESEGEEAQPFSLDDIDATFSKFVTLKYEQRSTIDSPKAVGITITPFVAGHMLGGAVWRISSEEEDIIYAVDYNHQLERHLDGIDKNISGQANKLEQKRPSLLITNSYVVNNPSNAKSRDLFFLSSISEALNNHGNVLIPVDTAGRLLEFTQILDKQWKKLQQFPIIILSHVAPTVINIAMSQIESMSERTNSEFRNTQVNPFKFNHIKTIQTLEELDSFTPPYLVLASLEGMSKGYSLELFRRWATNKNNLVLLTNSTSSGELPQKLLDSLAPQTFVGLKGTVVPYKVLESELQIELKVSKRVPLTGDELDQYTEEAAERDALESANLDQDEMGNGNINGNRGSSNGDGDGNGYGYDDGDGSSSSSMSNFSSAAAQFNGRRERRKSSMMMMDTSHNDNNGEDDDDDDDDEDEDEIKILRAKYDVSNGTTGVGKNKNKGNSRLRFKRDIYVLGDESLLSKRGSFFKQTRTFPMFPFVEHQSRKRADEWGEPIRKADYELISSEFTDTLHNPFLNIQNSAGSTAMEITDGSNEIDDKSVVIADSQQLRSLLKRKFENTPCKTHIENVTLNVACKVLFLDLEGRADFNSIKNITESINPKQLIIVHGSVEASRQLQTRLQNNASNHITKIHIADIGEFIDASSDHNIYQVKLRDPLVSSLKFSKMGAYDFAYFHGQIHMPEDDVVAMPELDLLPSNLITPHKQVFIGNTNILDLKEVLIQAGFRAEFIHGVLVCNDTIAIRKYDSNFQIEGDLSEDYFAIREILYSQFATV